MIKIFDKKHRWILHALFWVTYHTIFLLLIIQFMPLKDGVTRVFFSLILHVTVAYTNWFWYIPGYFNQKKYVQYFTAIITTLFAATFIRVWLEKELAGMLPVIQNIKSIRFSINLFSMNMIWITSSLFRLLEDYIDTQERESELKTQKLEAELKLLKHQINPHFLFNTLNNLYSQVYRKTDEAAPLLLKLSSVLRYMLYECNDQKVPLKKEISYLHDCIDLHILNPEDKNKIKFTTEVEDPSIEIEPLLFINFLENAFKHGNLTDPAGFIMIQLIQTSKNLEFKIKNSKGKYSGPKDQTKGIGILNIEQRLKNISPYKHHLELKNTDQSFEVDLKLEL